MAIPRGEWGRMPAAVAGMPFGTGPKKFISRKVIGTLAIPFGRGVFGYKGDNEYVAMPTADTNTLTLDGVLVTANVYTITLNGIVYAETFATSSAVTLAAIVAQLDAVEGIVASLNGLIITATTKGVTIVITGVVTLGAGQATATAGTPAISADLIFLGVATRLANETNAPTQEESSYKPGQTISIMNFGAITVECDATVPDVNTKARVLKTVAGIGKFTSFDTGAGLLVEAFYQDAIPDDTLLMVAHLEGSTTVVA